jgi:hypothetical protein
MSVHLLAGQPVGVNRNYNDRTLQRLLAAGRNIPPDLLVLGSSTSLELTADNFCVPAKGYFNASVSGATLKDLLAIYWLYSRNGAPRRILVEITPLLFRPDPAETRWRTLADEYEAILNNGSMFPAWARAYASLGKLDIDPIRPCSPHPISRKRCERWRPGGEGAHQI